MRNSPNISEKHLRACLYDQYNLSPVTLEFLPRGHDFSAGVYRTISERGTAYLLKVTSRPLYEPRYLIPAFLKDQGITSVVAPIPTISGSSWTQLQDWAVSVFPYIEGSTGLAGMTQEHWKEAGAIFNHIHQVTLPHTGFVSLRKETFDPTEYVQWVQDFEIEHAHSTGRDATERAFLSCWMEHRSTIQMVVTSLEKLAEVLQSLTVPHVICHADLHASNLICDHAGNVFVIDWDEVMLAPKERDFIFVRQPHADVFFQGYGVAEIDWKVLTYYLWERVVQDLIECAQNVCLRDDLGEESKTYASKAFQEMLAEKEGGHIDAAYAAADHLPFDLSVHIKKRS
ncbi:spectinomycin phosphotransferase [Paenibacillus sp. yr247]|uniref:phosphotransferase n=1 Tax=Paenibacillus sp. yr247 TaxID=1761880 RepID=UPI00088D577C|nr:aminoglycoside phosphotransferase family protein [Paenibacillus sp. yr247]SDP08738.1 spectinomycin phosphotransferase [Paenibacillus sp. yr247]